MSVETPKAEIAPAVFGTPVRKIDACNIATTDIRELTEAGVPILLKGAADDWPVVAAARQSDTAATDYLLDFYNGRPVVLYRADKESGGKFFYNADLTGFNFSATEVNLRDVIDVLHSPDARSKGDALYVGSTDLDAFFPGMAARNAPELAPLAESGQPVLGSIWIGNRTTATAHFDISNNIACCIAGRRRFTLFPPDQIENLYPGPIEPTPAGQVVSMVDIARPNLDRFPQFAKAMAKAQVAEMEPGDILIYPSMWWHQVEALEPFNILINYWWNAVPAHFDTPMNTMLHALLSLRDRPAYEKAAWRALFDYYVFGDPDLAAGHLPTHARGELAPMRDPNVARRLRAKLLNRLNR